jgi:uncharacterized protein involved in response to NO
VKRISDWVLFELGFRVFFLLAGLAGVGLMSAWIGLLSFGPWPGAPVDPVAWHAHEMVFGFAGAAIAGFLLTAVPRWVAEPGPGGRSSPPLSGGPLLLLALAWLAGRAVQAWAGVVPAELRVLVELIFPVGLAWWVGQAVIAARRLRNLVVVFALVLFAIADLLTQVTLYDAAHVRIALSLSPHLPAVLIAIIGGRIIPAFTGNWLRSEGPRARGETALPVVVPAIEGLAIPAALIALAADGFALHQPTLGGILGWVLLACGLIHLLRWSLWRGTATLAEPIVAILHIAYLWLPLAYLALGASYLTDSVVRSGALHLLTAGTMGSMILAVMTRVSLGHTGRPIEASQLTVLSYVAVVAAGALRALASFVPGTAAWSVPASGAAWILAYTLFLVVYAPVLVSPRRPA